MLFVLLLLTLLINVLVAQWSSNPAVNNPISTAAGNQFNPVITTDGSGGAIIAWQDQRSGNYDIYAQRIDIAGVVRWTIDGILISPPDSNQINPTITSDSTGGAIITWQDHRSGNDDIYAQRLNGAGETQWTDGGVAISTAANDQFNPIIISDSLGGAFIAWQSTGVDTYPDLYAQRINSAGAVQWTIDGVAISSAAHIQSNHRIARDALGGLLITWQDYRNGTYDIYAQRINGAGVIQWPADGLAIRTGPNNQTVPAIVGDGIGGAIIVWQDWLSFSTYDDILGQHVSAIGSPYWGSYQIISATANPEISPSIINDGAGGAIITWYANDIHAQRVDYWGYHLWTSSGVAFSANASTQANPTIIGDGTGGAIIIWRSRLYACNYCLTSVQRITNTGIAQWKAGGALVSSRASYFNTPNITIDGTGGAIITLNYGNDIYAQNVDRFGNIGTGKFNFNAVTDIADDQGGKVRVSWQKLAPDTSTANSQLVHYNLWRKISPGSSANKKDTFADDSLSNYEFLTTVPAVQSPKYNVVVPTLEDSSATGIHRASFLVTAHTSNINSYYVSDEDSGYSVNNFEASGNSTVTYHAKSQPASPTDNELVSISDIPHDQGGQVRLRWSRSSSEDSVGSSQGINYCVWRKIPPDQTLPKTKPKVMQKLLGAESLSEFDYLTTVPAVQIPYYNFIVSTLADSTAEDINRFTFVVTAHTGNVNTYSISPPDSGYSVDNLSPSNVVQVSASMQLGPSVIVHWRKNTADPDVRFYEVHRSTTSGFISGDSTTIGITSDTSLVDASPVNGVVNYYRVIVVDIHGNKSSPSPQASAEVAATQQVAVHDRWNMISVPLTVPDFTATTLYPSATSPAYKYAGSYQAQSALQNGTGYWLKFSGNQTVDITGFLRNEDTVNVVKNWNMIGSISEAISTDNIMSIPDGMITSQFYNYEGSYIASTSIEPGKAYWVKVNQNGKLILSSSSAQPKSRITISPIPEAPPSAPDEDIATTNPQLPATYALQQNYPNPFNPSTVIRYAIPAGAIHESPVHVVLKVYTVLGEEVVTLVNEAQQAGYKSVEWDASSMPSGMYFYCLTAGNFIEVKKMLMIK